MNSKDKILVEGLKKVIDNKSIRTLFQPIIDLKDGQILGYEALSRGPEGSDLESPYRLFTLAREHNMLFRLEQVCREKALLNSETIGGGTKLFLNVDPGVIYDNSFKGGITKEIIENINISQEDIVIELTETTCIDDYKGFSLALDHYKQQGYQIAIDDTGAGYSGLQSIVSISYNYIKLDRSLVQNIDSEPIKQALLESFMRFARRINSKVIAEGIETMAELDTLLAMGVDYGQGYLIARPQQQVDYNLDIIDYILKKNEEKRELLEPNIIGKIAKRNIIVDSSVDINEVIDIFKEDKMLGSLVVLNNEKIIGLITRNRALHNNLNQNKDIGSIIKENPLKVDYYTAIEEVIDKSMKRDFVDIYDCIIITKNNNYFGTVSIKELLKFFLNLSSREKLNLDYFNGNSQRLVI
ncbi:EAL domain-containing protein (putative c-di-GMP-specific phosphodiesterase class I) [Orenia metallireducens]|jgi:EAL domain-containing protein (putative c-di-GMP-specific phosphodiesterase class I)/CBS domain-containing protein|uniref:EAL domain, c-di-GMP-specific phosphodiesterase class I (Or its enzymatically inactive variant) n=1 Tax=Orenia metallireducens TaxID=1413210 RepID=A0A285GWY9_9FIRM|nr:EAL domain-containing protein [Orenia metallireducens]PRX31067.1 EAL domain-containing protein (putative c-di-GMP-specific phosphodiesterase class I) [Orenia metallireducens]SNY27793.1 EAL domain, c-di-GMP-specific phosphodiesterase class I (or its enzymatically inactive variant) [Orenia metallireducens]